MFLFSLAQFIIVTCTEVQYKAFVCMLFSQKKKTIHDYNQAIHNEKI